MPLTLAAVLAVCCTLCEAKTVGEVASADETKGLVLGQVNTGQKSAGEEAGVQVSLCVPCIPKDRPALMDLARSLSRQTLPPHELVVAISETTSEQGAALQQELIKVFPRSVVLATTEPQYAGQNRQRAINSAGGSIISFMDADDEMHPQRLEIVAGALKAFKTKCVLHTFILDKDQPEKQKYFGERFDDWKSRPKALGHDIYNKLMGKDTKQTDMGLVGSSKGFKGLPQHGHVTCTSEAMRALKQSPAPRGQDQEFLRSVLSYYGDDDKTMALIDTPLTYYHPSDHPDNTKWFGNSIDRAFGKGLNAAKSHLPHLPRRNSKVSSTILSPTVAEPGHTI